MWERVRYYWWAHNNTVALVLFFGFLAVGFTGVFE